MQKRVGLAVVGCGRVAYSHLTAIKELSDMAELVATVSRTKEHAEEAARKFGARRYYISLEEALQDSEIDAVVLCLPHHLHASISVKALEHGKHVLVEKPMANTAKEAEEMIGAAEKNGVILMSGQSRRFYNAVLESKRYLDEGKIGKLININATLFGYVDKPPTPWWSSAEKAGGLIIPLFGSHTIDYILWLFGKAPSRVYAETYSNNPNWQGEDEATILMGFDDGSMASATMSWNARLVKISGMKADEKILPTPIYNRYVIGTEGTMHLEDELELSLNGEKLVSGPQKPGNFHLQMKEFVTSIIEGREPLASGKEVKKVVEVMEASQISAKEHRVVCL